MGEHLWAIFGGARRVIFTFAQRVCLSLSLSHSLVIYCLDILRMFLFDICPGSVLESFRVDAVQFERVSEVIVIGNLFVAFMNNTCSVTRPLESSGE